MKLSRKRFKSTELLASVLGIGSIGAAIAGIVGAVFGSLIGAGVAIWGEEENEGFNHTGQKTRGKKAHA